MLSGAHDWKERRRLGLDNGALLPVPEPPPIWGIGNPGPDWKPTTISDPATSLSDFPSSRSSRHRTLKWAKNFHSHRTNPYDYYSTHCRACRHRLAGKPYQTMSGRTAWILLRASTHEWEIPARKPFVKVNGASDVEQDGRPIQTPQPAGSPTWPRCAGRTNGNPPSYRPEYGPVLFLRVGELRPSSFARKNRNITRP